VTAALALAAAAGGHGPVAHIACKRIAPGVCEESGNVDLPPDGYASQTTDTVPSQSRESDSLLEPLGQNELAAFDSLWETVADGSPKLADIKNTTVRRVLTCSIMARGFANFYGVFSSKVKVNAQVKGDNAYAALLSICIEATITGQQAAGVAADQASVASCSQAVVSMPIQISHTSSGWLVQVNSPVTKASGRKPLAISCQPKGKGLLIKVRPRRRGQKLRKVIGGHFSLGYANPTTSPVQVHTTFTFR
jgi:hypothetical protein